MLTGNPLILSFRAAPGKLLVSIIMATNNIVRQSTSLYIIYTGRVIVSRDTNGPLLWNYLINIMGTPYPQEDIAAGARLFSWLETTDPGRGNLWGPHRVGRNVGEGARPCAPTGAE